MKLPLLPNRYLSTLFLGVVAGAWVGTVVQGQTVTQRFDLSPGWNAIWLEVQPEERDPAVVFASLDVASVWTYSERVSATDFIQDPSEENFNASGWLGWFPPARPEAFLSNLHAMQAHRAYLINLQATTPVLLTITGRPSLRSAEWLADAYHLRGLPVDETQPPTFREFFRNSTAHYDAQSQALQPIYRLDRATGRWVLASSTGLIQRGEAYWIYARAASTYEGPINVSVTAGDGLDFGQEVSELSLKLAGIDGAALNVTIEELGGDGTRALAYRRFDPALGYRWIDLPPSLNLSAPPGDPLQLRVAVRRQLLSGPSYHSILRITDGAGVSILAPVHAQTFAGAGAGDPDNSGGLAGLWVGTATVKAVSEVHSADPTTPTPTRSTFHLRQLIHVDHTGQARLLKEVIQMWQNGSYTTDPEGNQVVDETGRYVLLTDDSLLGYFSGSAIRDGVSTGRRLSSVGYDFPAADDENYVVLTGAFGVGKTLAGTLMMPANHPRNPFAHRYHPDHDNLNARFDGPAEEAYATQREIAWEFTVAPPDGMAAAPDYGYGAIGGNYREKITGLHQTAIYITGTFQLNRASSIAQLNPTPAR